MTKAWTVNHTLGIEPFCVNLSGRGLGSRPSTARLGVGVPTISDMSKNEKAINNLIFLYFWKTPDFFRYKKYKRGWGFPYFFDLSGIASSRFIPHGYVHLRRSCHFLSSLSLWGLWSSLGGVCRNSNTKILRCLKSSVPWQAWKWCDTVL